MLSSSPSWSCGLTTKFSFSGSVKSIRRGEKRERRRERRGERGGERERERGGEREGEIEEERERRERDHHNATLHIYRRRYNSY